MAVAQSERKSRVRRARSEMYRSLIVESAETLFAAKGVDDSRMAEIAAAAGVSLGTLYSVFAGKAEIVSAIHDQRLSALLKASTDNARGEHSTIERLVAGVRGYVDYFLANPNYLRMHLREGYTWAGERAAATRLQAEAWGAGLDLLTSLFERGIREGVIHQGDASVHARLLIAAQQVQLAAWIEGGMKLAPSEVLTQVETYLRRAFCK